MDVKAPGSHVKSVRISKETWNVLQEESREEGVSANALVDDILEAYVRYGRHAKRFGVVCLSRHTLRAILNAMEKDQLERAAQDAGEENPKEAMRHWFGEVSLDTFIAYVRLLSKHAGFGEIQVRTGGPRTSVAFRHDLGRPWSVFLGTFLSHSLRTALGLVPIVDATRTAVVLEFKPDLNNFRRRTRP